MAAASSTQRHHVTSTFVAQSITCHGFRQRALDASRSQDRRRNSIGMVSAERSAVASERASGLAAPTADGHCLRPFLAMKAEVGDAARGYRAMSQ